MKLKELISKLKEFDGESEVWVEYSYNDYEWGDKSFGHFHKFKFKPAISGNDKPVLNISEEEDD